LQRFKGIASSSFKSVMGHLLNFFFSLTTKLSAGLKWRGKMPFMDGHKLELK